MRSLARVARDALVMLVAAALLLGAAEVGTRLVLRLATGRWPQTLAAAYDDAHRATATLYHHHPFLIAAPRPGARDPRLGRIEVNSLGYRSPERPLAKPAGVARVVCAGGSTTWDVLANSNETTWPALVESELRAGGRAVEVWNAGFPGWTTLENLIAFESRDLELRPDVVVLYQGINDLQPASHEPVDPDYADFHAALQRASIGLDLPPIPWWDRLVLVERARDALFGHQLLRMPGTPVAAGPPRRALAPDGVRIFERNVRSLVAVARAHGVRVILATQPLRRREKQWDRDRDVFAFWLPDLEPEAALVEIERLNDVLRAVAADGQAALADVVRDVAWTDADFGDPMHTTAVGTKKLATFLAGPIGRELARE